MRPLMKRRSCPTGSFGRRQALSRDRSAYGALVGTVTVVLVVAGACLTPAVFARIARNTIDPLATVSHHGARVRLTGPIEIQPAGELMQQRVTVTQRSTGAVAQGLVHLRGTGAAQRWEVTCLAHGRERFVPGPATAVGLARTLTQGRATDAHQWLVDVTLVAD